MTDSNVPPSVTAPVDLTLHVPGMEPVTCRVGEIHLALSDTGGIDEGQLGRHLGDFLAAAAEVYRKEEA